MSEERMIETSTRTEGTRPKYLRILLPNGEGRDPHCRNSHHAHYIPDEKATPYERACRETYDDD